MKDTIEEINNYIEGKYSSEPRGEKIFYHWSEWSGWKFYKKALRHRDFGSIWSHIKSKFI